MDTKHCNKTYSISRNYIINNFFLSFYQIFENRLNILVHFDLWQKPQKGSCTLSTIVEISRTDEDKDEFISAYLSCIEESLTEFIGCCSNGLDLKSLSGWIVKVNNRFQERVATDKVWYTPITATELLEPVKILERTLKKIAGVDGVIFSSDFGEVCLQRESINYNSLLDEIVPPRTLFHSRLRVRVLIQVNVGTAAWRLKSSQEGSFWASLRSSMFLSEFQAGERGGIDPKAVLLIDLKVTVWKSGCTEYRTVYLVQKVHDDVLLPEQYEQQDLY